jgi:ABC-type nitrate/sulfonate/bicarbonate transport system ATPase subunit
MENEIIIVVGKSAVGKSTVIEMIYQLLLNQGFEVELAEDIDYKDNEDFLKQMSEHREDRIEAVKKKTKITLREVQMKYA